MVELFVFCGEAPVGRPGAVIVSACAVKQTFSLSLGDDCVAYWAPDVTLRTAACRWNHSEVIAYTRDTSLGDRADTARYE